MRAPEPLFQRPVTWAKHGLLIEPRRDLWWMRSHAMVPTVEPRGGGLYRVYFSGRDDRNRSHIGWAEIDLSGEPRVAAFAEEPVLTLGELGTFDDNGVTPSCVVRSGERSLLYYIGWNQGTNVRMHLYGGLAHSEDGGATFTRWSRAPILERIRIEPFLNTAPYVIRQPEGWRMYYVSCTGWLSPDLPRYHIRTATSADGYRWRREGAVAIDYADENENALARPMVLRDGDIYRMWFACKGTGGYRVGYAESADGVAWHRRDDLAGIGPSEDGWDSQMICYAFVFEHEGRKAMLYNGNDYGAGGIGLALEAPTR
ncbi:MAG: hypothetical protein WD270_10460 [Acetobacterales bacterium]